MEDFQYPSYLECHLERVCFKKTKKKLNFESEESLPSGNASLYNEIQSQFKIKPAEVPLLTSQPPKRQRKQIITRRDEF